jgi:predicted GIY-YIG superfamily endonuclease
VPARRFVYLLRSKSTNRPYFGLTSDIVTRLAAHNAGQNKSTAPFCPWVLVTLIEFSDETTAANFERFLKTGSGRAFAKQHLL